MSMVVETEIDVQSILNKHHLGNDNKAWLLAGQRFKTYCDRYVPFAQGTLKNTVTVSASKQGAQVRYTAPYAHYQYYGKTMGPNVLTKLGWRSMARKGGKYYTGGTLTYHGAGRGSKWDKKMLSVRKGDLIDDIAAYVGGKRK